MLLGALEAIQWDVILYVLASVVVHRTLGAGDQYGGPLGDTIDVTGQVFPLIRKGDQIALGYSQSLSRQVSRCEELVVGFGVAKKSFDDSLERFGGAVRVIP